MVGRKNRGVTWPKLKTWYLCLPCCVHDFRCPRTYIYHYWAFRGHRIVVYPLFHLRGYLGSFSVLLSSTKHVSFNVTVKFTYKMQCGNSGHAKDMSIFCLYSLLTSIRLPTASFAITMVASCLLRSNYHRSCTAVTLITFYKPSHYLVLRQTE